MFKFKVFLDTTRFGYLLPELEKVFKIRRIRREVLRKTAVFVGEKFNLFIDTSDGVNEDLGIKEYCGRIIRVVTDYPDKPFLYLKSNFSPSLSSTIVGIANAHGGRVEPTFIWTFRPGFYDHILPNLAFLRNEAKSGGKVFDLGFMGNMAPYRFPKPNLLNPLVAWSDYSLFGIGSPVSTGYFEVNTRQVLCDELAAKTRFFLSDGEPFEEYVANSFRWKVCLNAPGIGEFTARAFIHSALGQPVLFRANSYDNPVSWKESWPEVNFKKTDWPTAVTNIVDRYEEWGEKSLEYFETNLRPAKIVKQIVDSVEKFESSLG